MIRHLAWKSPHAAGAALENTKRQKKKNLNLKSEILKYLEKRQYRRRNLKEEANGTHVKRKIQINLTAYNNNCSA